MSLAIWLLFCFCALGTSVVSALTGMGGGVLLMVILTLFAPTALAVPIHGVTQLFSNGTRTWLLRKYVRREFLFPFLLGIPFGIFPSIWLIQKFSNETLPIFLIATLIMYTLFRPKKLPPLKVKGPYFFFHGAIAAFLCLFVGAVGPFLAPFFIRDDLIKEEIVSTKAAMQLSIHLIKIPSFLYLGFAYEDYVLPIIALAACAWLGTRYGVHLLKKLDQGLFEKLFKAFLFIAGVRLYYKVFSEVFL